MAVRSFKTLEIFESIQVDLVSRPSKTIHVVECIQAEALSDLSHSFLLIPQHQYVRIRGTLAGTIYLKRSSRSNLGSRSKTRDMRSVATWVHVPRLGSCVAPIVHICEGAHSKIQHKFIRFPDPLKLCM